MLRETEMLLACASLEPGEGDARRIRVLAGSGLNWESLVQQAIRHGVMPLVYRTLLGGCPDLVPAILLQQLRDCFHTNSRRCLLLSGRLVEILRLLDANGIPAIPYKGPVLAASVYGNPVLRQAGDLDILVPRRDVFRAKTLMSSLRYEDRNQTTSDWEAVRARADYEFRLVRKSEKLYVGLHWDIWPPSRGFPLKRLHLWERTEPLPFGGATVRCIDPEGLLLLLCAHGVKDVWPRLISVCDVAEVVRKYRQLNWNGMLREAETIGLARVLLLGLQLAHTLLDTSLPGWVSQRIKRDDALTSMVKETVQRLLNGTQPPDAIDASLYHVRSRERLSDRLRSYPGLVHQYNWMTPRAVDRTVMPLPASLDFVYSLVWPLRLAGKHLLRPARRFIRTLRRAVHK
jgi:hypothetical protein